MGRKKEYRFDWINMSIDEKIAVYEAYRKTANRRLRRLRESGMNYPILTQDYLDRTKHRTFTKVRGKSITEINSALMAVESFLDIETSTLTGIRKVAERIKKRVDKYYTEHTGEGRKLNVSNRDLLNFVHSATYKRLRSRYDSYFLFEEFESAQAGGSSEEVMLAFEEFANNQISIQDVRNRFAHA